MEREAAHEADGDPDRVGHRDQTHRFCEGIVQGAVRGFQAAASILARIPRSTGARSGRAGGHVLRRSHPAALAVLVGLIVVLVGCAPAASTGPASSPRASDAAVSSDLLAAAREEGSITTIALSRSWCNYGAIIDAFKKAYGLEVAELDPNAVSADQVEALRASASSSSPPAQTPDVVDLGLAYGPVVRTEKLVAPYRPAAWDAIRPEARDPDGYWSGAYYGVIAFEVNGDAIKDPPEDWDDLLNPSYAGRVSLAGDPRSSSQAAAAVAAASLANGGTLDDVAPGLAFFRRMADAKTLSARPATTDSIVSGKTPIALRWTYLALADRAADAAKKAKDRANISVIVPRTGRVAVPFIQAISATARHPRAAQLWQEHMLGADAQAMLLAGGCHPIRFDELVSRDLIARDVLTSLPDVSGAAFPTVEQLAAATAAIDAGWETTVGVEIS